jgi:hypothetical protein
MRKYIVGGSALLAVLTGMLLYFGGFVGGASDAGLVPMDQVPPGFLDIARKELPAVKFDKVWKLRNGNYEIRGKDAKGKAREVEVNAKGEVVEVD